MENCPCENDVMVLKAVLKQTQTASPIIMPRGRNLHSKSTEK